MAKQVCRHFIISNSTFSSWAAWLGSNPGKRVVCPAPEGVKHAVSPCSDWIVMDDS